MPASCSFSIRRFFQLCSNCMFVLTFSDLFLIHISVWNIFLRSFVVRSMNRAAHIFSCYIIIIIIYFRFDIFALHTCESVFSTFSYIVPFRQLTNRTVCDTSKYTENTDFAIFFCSFAISMYQSGAHKTFVLCNPTTIRVKNCLPFNIYINPFFSVLLSLKQVWCRYIIICR